MFLNFNETRSNWEEKERKTSTTVSCYTNRRRVSKQLQQSDQYNSNKEFIISDTKYEIIQRCAEVKKKTVLGEQSTLPGTLPQDQFHQRAPTFTTGAELVLRLWP